MPRTWNARSSRPPLAQASISAVNVKHVVGTLVALHLLEDHEGALQLAGFAAGVNQSVVRVRVGEDAFGLSVSKVTQRRPGCGSGSTLSCICRKIWNARSTCWALPQASMSDVYVTVSGVRPSSFTC